MKNADMPSMPISCVTKRINGKPQEWTNYKGMTKREIFAMHAMQGELAGSANHSRPDPEDVAHFAAKCADALLKELEK